MKIKETYQKSMLYGSFGYTLLVALACANESRYAEEFLIQSVIMGAAGGACFATIYTAGRGIVNGVKYIGRKFGSENKKGLEKLVEK